MNFSRMDFFQSVLIVRFRSKLNLWRYWFQRPRHLGLVRQGTA